MSEPTLQEAGYCLNARMDGPDWPPFLCYLARGHSGQHEVNVDGGNQGRVHRWDGGARKERR